MAGHLALSKSYRPYQPGPRVPPPILKPTVPNALNKRHQSKEINNDDQGEDVAYNESKILWEVNVPSKREVIREVFKRNDANKDGKLSWDEVKAAFVELKAMWPWFRTEQAIRHADNDHDNYINIQNEEFDALVDYAIKCGFPNK